MQSDFDVLVRKLNFHLEDSDLLLRSGVLRAELDGVDNGDALAEFFFLI